MEHQATRLQKTGRLALLLLFSALVALAVSAILGAWLLNSLA